jgi:hypothetical protein
MLSDFFTAFGIFKEMNSIPMTRRPILDPLTEETAERLRNVLRRRGGSCTLRDLYRRHSFWDHRILNEAAEAGIIRFEMRQPRTGRPSTVVVLCAPTVNNSPPAKLPRRADLPLGLSWKEQRFLARFAFRWGTSYFGEGKNGGCATNAYAVAFGLARKTSRASDRSSASRLLRRPWIEAGFLLDRRLMNFGGRIHWPADLRSAADEWIGLLLTLDRLWSQWPLDIASAIRRARTYPEAIGGLRDLAATRAAALAARADTSEVAVHFTGMSPSGQRMISQGYACEGRGIEEPAQAASAIAG